MAVAAPQAPLFVIITLIVLMAVVAPAAGRFCTVAATAVARLVVGRVLRSTLRREGTLPTSQTRFFYAMHYVMMEATVPRTSPFRSRSDRAARAGRAGVGVTPLLTAFKENQGRQQPLNKQPRFTTSRQRAKIPVSPFVSDFVPVLNVQVVRAVLAAAAVLEGTVRAPMVHRVKVGP